MLFPYIAEKYKRSEKRAAHIFPEPPYTVGKVNEKYKEKSYFSIIEWKVFVKKRKNLFFDYRMESICKEK